MCVWTKAHEWHPLRFSKSLSQSSTQKAILKIESSWYNGDWGDAEGSCLEMRNNGLGFRALLGGRSVNIGILL